MERGNNIKSLYYTHIATIGLCLILGIIGLLHCFIDYQNIIFEAFGIVMFGFMLIGFLLLTIYSFKEMILVIRDYSAIKNGKYLMMYGKVLKFKKNRDLESGIQINCKPIIQCENGQTMVLHVNIELRENETYFFKYLKYTKFAEVVRNPNLED